MGGGRGGPNRLLAIISFQIRKRCTGSPIHSREAAHEKTVGLSVLKRKKTRDEWPSILDWDSRRIGQKADLGELLREGGVIMGEELAEWRERTLNRGICGTGGGATWRRGKTTDPAGSERRWKDQFVEKKQAKFSDDF